MRGEVTCVKAAIMKYLPPFLPPRFAHRSPFSVLRPPSYPLTPPAARPRFDRFRCGGRECNFLTVVKLLFPFFP